MPDEYCSLLPSEDLSCGDLTGLVFATSTAARLESDVRPAARDTAGSAGPRRPQAREHQFICKWGTSLAPGETKGIPELESSRSNNSKSAGHSSLRLPLRLPGSRVISLVAAGSSLFLF